MSLTRWDPLREMSSLRQAMNRLFDESLVRPEWTGEEPRANVFVPLDVYETADHLVVTAPMPGVQPDEVDITVQDNVLTIRGEFRREEEDEGTTYHHRERAYGSFARTIRLPNNVEAGEIEATFEEGVLTLRAPKREEAKSRKIEVKTSS